MKRIRRGDPDACEELVRTHYERVYALLTHLGRDVHLADDLTQETFVAAWANIGKFAGRSSLITWLSQIAYRKFIDARRRGLVHAQQAEEYRQQCAMQTEDHPTVTDLAAADRRRRLHSALDELDEDDRTLLTLHYLQDLSYREMAAVLEKPSGTVKWQTSQALHRLRSHLNGELEL